MTPTLNDDLRLSTPLAQLVIDAPGSERILESFGLDYCCVGQSTLGEACAAADVDPADVLARLDDMGPTETPEWNTMTPDALVDHIEGYEPPEDACNSYRGLYDGLAQLEEGTVLHVHKENNLLFPAVVALEEALAGSIGS